MTSLSAKYTFCKNFQAYGTSISYVYTFILGLLIATTLWSTDTCDSSGGGRKTGSVSSGNSCDCCNDSSVGGNGGWSSGSSWGNGNDDGSGNDDCIGSGGGGGGRGSGNKGVCNNDACGNTLAKLYNISWSGLCWLEEPYWSWSVVTVVSRVLDCEDCNVGNEVAVIFVLGINLIAGGDCKELKDAQGTLLYPDRESQTCSWDGNCKCGVVFDGAITSGSWVSK